MAVEQAADGAGSAAPGMPQLDFSSFPNQIFWLAVTLVAMWWILSRIALPRIGAVLAERAGTISNDIAAAEELSLRVKDAEAAYEKALVDARAEANRIVGETRAAIKVELAAATASADREIAARAAESEKQIGAIRATAADSIREVAEATAREIVAALGGTSEPADIAAAVAERVKG
jgi:F-type H+-transporting ATPase subunit b